MPIATADSGWPECLASQRPDHGQSLLPDQQQNPPKQPEEIPGEERKPTRPPTTDKPARRQMVNAA